MFSLFVHVHSEMVRIWATFNVVPANWSCFFSVSSLYNRYLYLVLLCHQFHCSIDVCNYRIALVKKMCMYEFISCRIWARSMTGHNVNSFNLQILQSKRNQTKCNETSSRQSMSKRLAAQSTNTRSTYDGYSWVLKCACVCVCLCEHTNRQVCHKRSPICNINQSAWLRFA